MTYELGIDNGMTGAAIFTAPSEGLPVPISKYAFKTVSRPDGNHLDSEALYQWIAEFRATSEALTGIYIGIRATVEEPAKGQGRLTTATAIASTHTSFGRTLAILEMLKIPYITVPASTWMTRLWGKDGEWAMHGKEDKPSVSIAPKLFPNFDWRRSTLGKLPSDGVCDAYMLALFGARYYTTEPRERDARDAKTKEAKKRKRERTKALKELAAKQQEERAHVVAGTDTKAV